MVARISPPNSSTWQSSSPADRCSAEHYGLVLPESVYGNQTGPKTGHIGVFSNGLTRTTLSTMSTSPSCWAEGSEIPGLGQGLGEAVFGLGPDLPQAPDLGMYLKTFTLAIRSARWHPEEGPVDKKDQL